MPRFAFTCDNPKCNFTIPYSEDMEAHTIAYLNQPCPICGENLLTEQDYIQHEKMKPKQQTKKMNKREVIFQMPDTEYRVVCRYGYDSMIKYAWWGHLQKKIYYKKWIFFGEQKWKWVEVDSCWWSKEIDTMVVLKNAAYNFFDENVLLVQRLNKKAMEL